MKKPIFAAQSEKNMKLRMKSEIIYIFLSGGTGSVLRYAMQLFLHERITPYHFPWSTLTVNLTGSLLIGVFYTLSAHSGLSNETRLLLTTGLCGGFTTFSTFSHDSVLLLRQGCYASLLLYLLSSLILGIAATFLGAFLAENAIFWRKN